MLGLFFSARPELASLPLQGVGGFFRVGGCAARPGARLPEWPLGRFGGSRGDGSPLGVQHRHLWS
jgi:hypothetical protein